MRGSRLRTSASTAARISATAARGVQARRSMRPNASRAWSESSPNSQAIAPVPQRRSTSSASGPTCSSGMPHGHPSRRRAAGVAENSASARVRPECAAANPIATCAPSAPPRMTARSDPAASITPARRPLARPASARRRAEAGAAHLVGRLVPQAIETVRALEEVRSTPFDITSTTHAGLASRLPSISRLTSPSLDGIPVSRAKGIAASTSPARRSRHRSSGVPAADGLD